jgi:hypothetical protein
MIAAKTAIKGETTTSAQILKAQPVAIPANALAAIRTMAIVKFNPDASPNIL